MTTEEIICPTREQKLDRIHERLADRYLAILEDDTANVRASMLATVTKFLNDSGVLRARAEKIAELEKRIEELEAENAQLQEDLKDATEVDDEDEEGSAGCYLPFPINNKKQDQLQELEDSASTDLQAGLTQARQTEDKLPDQWSLAGRLEGQETGSENTQKGTQKPL